MFLKVYLDAIHGSCYHGHMPAASWMKPWRDDEIHDFLLFMAFFLEPRCFQSLVLEMGFSAENEKTFVGLNKLHEKIFFWPP